MANIKWTKPETDWLERTFEVRKRNSSVPTELRAGLSTFLVMAYIIFVNPSVLGSVADPNGEILPFPAVLSVTCLTAGVLTMLMGLLSNYPFALAPGMGLNAFVTYYLVGQLKLTWPQAMTVVLLEGLIILVLVLTRFREAMMDAIPNSLKQAIGGGIGLFLALIGFVNSGLVVRGEGTVLTLGKPEAFPVLVFLLGLAFTLWLSLRKVQGALLWGVLVATTFAVAFNELLADGHAFGTAARVPDQIAGLPQGLVGVNAIFGRWDLGFVAKLGGVSAMLVVFSLLLSDFFDTMGTVVALSEEGNFLDSHGRLPKLNRVLLVDSIGAALGGLANSSSNTTYIESGAGIASGGRTGLASVTTGILFLLAMFFSPIASIVPKEATAPALILVGFFMMTLIKNIPWSSYEEGVPAFLILLLMPFTYSITNGIGAGFISYTLLKLFAGKIKDIHPLMMIATLMFVIYFAWA